MSQLIPELYQHTYSQLFNAYQQGYEKEFFGIDWTLEDTKLVSRIQNNLFGFSAAKTYAEMVTLRDAVYQDGALVSKTDYIKVAHKINQKYNLTWLDTERQMVMMAGTQGSRWVDIQESADTHPYLEYVTARDERVREEHQRLDGLILPVGDDFWKQFYPPNGWKCRCSARKRTEREANHGKSNYKGRSGESMPDSELAQRIAGKVVDKPFRHNCGTSEIFQENGHPYYKACPTDSPKQLSAVRHYGMKPVENIYEYPDKLAPYRGSIKTKEDFNQYWSEMEEYYGKAGDGFALIDKKSSISAHFDRSLMAKMRDKKDRWNYFDEITEVFFKPDEVWGVYKGGERSGVKKEFFNTYIKYYEDTPIVLLVNSDGRVDSFYKWDRALSNFEDFRKGLLKKKR